MKLKHVLVLIGLVALAVGGALFAVARKNGQPPALATCQAPALARQRFGAPVQLTAKDSPGTYQFEPAAVMDGAGGVALVYIANVGMLSKNTIAGTAVSASGQVTPSRSLPTKKEQHFDPWMARDHQGRLYAVWLGFDRGFPERHMEIALSTSDDNGRTWTEPRAVQDPKDCPEGANGCMDKPMVVVGPDKADPTREAVYVLYFSEVAEALRAVKSVDRGQTFGPAVTAAPDAYATIQVTPSGAIHLAYMTADQEINRYGDPHSIIAYTRSDDGGKTFSAPITVSQGQSVPFFFSNPQVAADEARGLLYVAYPAGTPDGRWDIFLATSKDEGKTWTRVKVNDDAPCASHMVPNLALDPLTGDVHLVWLENRSGKGGLAYAVCASGGTSCGPNEAVNGAPFASYGMKRHDREWLGEYNALLLDPERRELHAVWGQTVDDGGGPTARLFYAKAALPKR